MSAAPRIPTVPELASDDTINALVDKFGSVGGENPFDPVTQAQHAEWKKALDRQRKVERIQAKYAQALQALPDAEATLRRAFRRWDALSRTAARLERALDKLHAETQDDGKAQA